MDYLVLVDSDLTINETESRCELEQAAGYQLDNIKFGTVIDEGRTFAVNKAEFNFESSMKILNNLHFVEVGEKDPNVITEEKKKLGWTPICDTRIYTEKHITRVLIFGTRS